MPSIYRMLLLFVLAASGAAKTAWDDSTAGGGSDIIEEQVDTPKPERLHLVDMWPRAAPRHFLFRGNNPMTKGNSTFPLGSLKQMLHDAASNECGVALPETLRFVDLDLENPTDPGYKDEVDFWIGRTDGALMKWATLGTLLDIHSTPFKDSLVSSGKWAIQGHGDHLTERLEATRAMLTNASAPPTVFYAHCNAGCDRTGEFIGACAHALRPPSLNTLHIVPRPATPLRLPPAASLHRTAGSPYVGARADAMRYLGYNVTTAMGEACRQCGRCPNFYATNSIGWYCLTLRERFNLTHLGDCTDFAGCHYLGDCDAHNPTHPANPCPTA